MSSGLSHSRGQGKMQVQNWATKNLQVQQRLPKHLKRIEKLNKLMDIVSIVFKEDLADDIGRYTGGEVDTDNPLIINYRCGTPITSPYYNIQCRDSWPSLTLHRAGTNRRLRLVMDVIMETAQLPTNYAEVSFDHVVWKNDKPTAHEMAEAHTKLRRYLGNLVHPKQLAYLLGGENEK
jgi:hypothetical protein